LFSSQSKTQIFHERFEFLAPVTMEIAMFRNSVVQEKFLTLGSNWCFVFECRTWKKETPSKGNLKRTYPKAILHRC